ncbi:Sec-independent protein translocase subunit TatA [Ornithinimicrobium humiphilum]|uniref:Sec-independent protein translocase protein TatA n=1 Tax=Ornithinimicrobium humiphilum TaxID=125288 RepID=A0A543KP74_9MICO|nr:Sec-independent protein translocase subunit TatA [Ornithinimicrobium humiphilum]TQM96864.1 sec-independent protein translocase protein TatA [Ornithinimicrobium humiphilum]
MRIQIWHVVVLIIAFVLLFGWKNLPNIARSMGESMRVFKSEVDQMKDDNEARKDRKADDATPGTLESGSQDTAQEDYRRLQERGDDGTPRA